MRMIISSINNRTENWKTAETFVPLLKSGIHSLARELGEKETTSKSDIHMQLYWKGMRDHQHQDPGHYSQDDIAERFNRLFPNLHKSVSEYRRDEDDRGFKELNVDNYVANTPRQRKALLSNLLHTEIDIVVESPQNLFIGEGETPDEF